MNKEKPELIIREDNILEINRANGQYFQINLNEVYFIMIEKGEMFIDILLNGSKNIHIPIEFYEGFIIAIKESGLFEVHKQNYYTISKKLKDLNDITAGYEKEKQSLNDVFVNIKSKNILLVTEEPKYNEDDTEKFAIDVINKGTVVFYKEENNG